MIIQMITRDEPPLFIQGDPVVQVRRRNNILTASTTKKITFVDIIESMIDLKVHTSAEIIEMVRLMQNEMDRISKRCAQ